MSAQIIMKLSPEQKAKRSYIVVLCPAEDCKETTIVFRHAKNEVFCKECNELLASPMGGKAEFHGKILGLAGEEIIIPEEDDEVEEIEEDEES